MYTIEFYENNKGQSQLWDFLENLRLKAQNSKDARIQFKQISLCIQLLQENGTCLPENITIHISDEIWALRPGNNRIFYFFYRNNTFILLHVFRKKTQMTPLREIEKAKAERNDYLARKGNEKNENMGKL